ncbi:MAG: tetraacyldisaccharide 4'-kinase, partial [Candidatus Poribacteria bacterium]
MSKVIQYLDSIISGEREGLIPSILKIELHSLSFLTLAITKLRRLAYSQGLFGSKELPCKVISVGNVVVGGSGKTPLTIAIANLLKKHFGLRIAVASRGYKSRLKGISIVSDGEKMLLSQDEAGDEPYMIGQRLADVPVIIGKDRYKSGLMAINIWGTQVLILDDGFQYLKLKHNVDLITIDSTERQKLNYI